ncbi:MAG: ParB-like nuclease domain-containing protein [Streptosporangiaceae bacterium]|nr:ParB-like nuclease domain-containing protein [Streptosporangiaceae bacterium]
MRVTAESATTRHVRASAAVTAWSWLDRQLDGCETSTCSIDLLLPADSPRLDGEVEEHVQLLAESPSPMPAIIVHRQSMRVIDGMHRLAAARLRGDTEIEVRWYEGDERDAFAMAVQTNVSHGLPLSLADRREAAARIIESHPHWSDRIIASIVNLAATTVGAIRACSSVHTVPSNTRLGRDGRIRPISTAEGRRLASKLLHDNPGAPLREIAQATGLAPSTVLDVRKRIQDGRDPVPSKQRAPGSATGSADKEPKAAVPLTRQADYMAVLQNLKKDPSLRYNDVGRMLLLWLQAGPIDSEARSKLAERLPPHSLGVIAAAARAHATAWQEFALQLERRNIQIL